MWTLKVIRGSELAEKLVPQMRLPQPLQCFTIGRDATNQWSIADRARAISARHCEIFDTPRGPAVRDVSTNGTFVNGALTRLEGEHLVREGDEDFQARADGPAWWRLVVRHDQLAGG